MEFKNGTVIEVIIDGLTYIGKFDEIKDGKVVLKNIMKITLAPHPNPDGKGFMMVPKLDLLNFYSIGDTFTFDVVDVTYSAEVTGKNFIDGYENQWNMYHSMKVEQGSNIQVVPAGNMPADIGIKTT